MSVRAALIALSLLVLAPRAEAFCGFFVAGSGEKLTNNASQVAIVRSGDKTALTMANNYKGPPENFAMVVPVPVVLHKEDVKTLPESIFSHLDALSAPRLVEYWETDPCAVEDGLVGLGSLGTIGYGGGSGNGRARGADHGVKIEAQFAVGEYEILVLSAQESGGLELWLREHKYTIPEGAAEALAPYVRSQMKFFVAKVDIKKVKRDENGVVQLSPLRVSYESTELRLPVRLGLLNAGGKQDLIIYILNARSRFEVANYPNVFVPTNLEVVDAVRKNFASFYAELFDSTLATKNGKAVVTEYAWQTTSCDPCPTDPLSPVDLKTLGGEPGNVSGGGGGSRGLGRGGLGYGMSYSPWVLTRLHTRYDKAALSDDLIFREAPPVTGGRARWDGVSDDAGAKVEARSGTNNFQGRYIIRHYWQAEVKCAEPKWGRWGGPPATLEGSFNGGSAKPIAARGLATAARGTISLKSSVRSPVPLLGLAGQPAPKHPKGN